MSEKSSATEGPRVALAPFGIGTVLHVEKGREGELAFVRFDLPDGEVTAVVAPAKLRPAPKEE